MYIFSLNQPHVTTFLPVLFSIECDEICDDIKIDEVIFGEKGYRETKCRHSQLPVNYFHQVFSQVSLRKTIIAFMGNFIRS